MSVEARVRELEEALEFYANPATWFGIGDFPLHTAGLIAKDWSDVGPPLGRKPGSRARRALTPQEVKA